MARYLYHFSKRVTFVVKDATPKTKFLQYYLEAHPNSMDICTIKHFENLGHQLDNSFKIIYSQVVELRNKRDEVTYASSADTIEDALKLILHIIPCQILSLIEPYGKDFRKSSEI